MLNTVLKAVSYWDSACSEICYFFYTFLLEFPQLYLFLPHHMSAIILIGQMLFLLSNRITVLMCRGWVISTNDDNSLSLCRDRFYKALSLSSCHWSSQHSGRDKADGIICLHFTGKEMDVQRLSDLAKVISIKSRQCSSPAVLSHHLVYFPLYPAIARANWGNSHLPIGLQGVLVKAFWSAELSLSTGHCTKGKLSFGEMRPRRRNFLAHWVC